LNSREKCIVANILSSDLREYIASLFAAKGMPAADAETVADVLVWANLRGVDSHGVLRATLYLDWIEQGLINVAPAFRVRNESAGAYVLDADRAAGPVAMSRAARGAVTKAREAGVGMVLVARTTHTATLGYYARHITSQDCACIMLSASGRHMPYYGTREAAVSTSPICIGVPAGTRDALVLDMAMSTVSAGRLMLAKRTDELLPERSAIDAAGVVTTDPAQAVLPLPIAGPKGAGLALMSELLTGMLTDEPILSEALANAKARHRQNAVIIAIDIARFTDPATFRAGVDGLASLITAMPRQPGFDAILMPGDRGDSIAERRRIEGIVIPDGVWAPLVAMGTNLGVAAPLEAP
jgi:ureidoglycolate dehydrogenase (NAD+)